jgi:hypothetical protein
MAFASLYNCQGAGFNIDIGSNPIDMKILGNGINTTITNVKVNSTFDTAFVGNSQNPPATMKLIIKDTNFANPGDNFKGIFIISSGSGIREFTGLQCIKGNE